MGVIKKKTAVRGTEGGVKYICDVCSADITSTVRAKAVPEPHAYNSTAVNCAWDDPGPPPYHLSPKSR